MADEERPKRRYDNSLRRAQAMATRAMVVDAAGELFLARGYAATTIEAVADLAGVPIATVYRLLGSKAAMLREVLDAAIGDEPALAVPADLPPGELLAAAVRFARELHEANGALYALLRGAAGGDEDAAALLARTEARRLEGLRAMAARLADHHALADGLTPAEAVDRLHALLSADVHRLLTRDRGWSGERYEAWLLDTLRTQLLAPAAR